jgi:hypothetical protein
VPDYDMFIDREKPGTLKGRNASEDWMDAVSSYVRVKNVSANLD